GCDHAGPRGMFRSRLLSERDNWRRCALGRINTAGIFARCLFGGPSARGWLSVFQNTSAGTSRTRMDSTRHPAGASARRRFRGLLVSRRRSYRRTTSRRFARVSLADEVARAQLGKIGERVSATDAALAATSNRSGAIWNSRDLSNNFHGEKLISP